MQAIVLEAYGEPDVLTLREIPAPEPSAGEVQVNVAVCGVNRADIALRIYVRTVFESSINALTNGIKVLKSLFHPSLQH